MSSLLFKKDQVNELPDKPGIYKYYDKTEKVIYVGKAKNLKKRVQSYFTKNTGLNWKTRRMVGEIEGIEVLLVNSEADAFHLENSIIKNLQPKYNIRLKDDKTYPFICITNERFPRIISTRKLLKEKGKYFGPYASVKGMNNVLRLINALYQLRTCKYDLSQENIEKGKFKVCLEYHIKNCQGPCEGLQSEDDYNADIEQAIEIIKGRTSLVKSIFKERMQYHAERLEFETADKFRYRIDLLEKFQSKSQIVNPNLTDIDVFCIRENEKGKVFLNYLMITNGSIAQSHSLEVSNPLQDNLPQTLAHSILILRDKFQSEARELITNIDPGHIASYKVQSIPSIGDKKKLVDLSIKNLLFYQDESQRRTRQNEQNRLLETVKKDLSLNSLPKVIECFDNSNIQGSNPVAAMVQFRNGKPFKKEYRKFNIKTVTGPDDFSSMAEIVERRYTRILNEKKNLPNLIIIDGGKGQLNAAVLALKKLNIYHKIPIIGIAKRLEELYFPGDKDPIHLDKKSESLRFIQKIRDEAHRFAITFHSIKGVGPKTRSTLLREFKTLNGILEAPVGELAKVVGKAKAELITNSLNKKRDTQANPSL